MNRFAVLFVTMALLVGISIPSYAQQEKKEEGHPQQGQPHAQPQHQQPAATHQAHPPQAVNRAPQHQGPPPQSYGGAYHGGVKYNGPTHGGVHHSGVPQNQTQVRAGFDQSHAHQWQNEHRTWAQRGGYHGYRVPDDRFRAYFGRPHPFRIYGLPLLFVGGYPRFQYDGYWMTLADPWPESWPANWYETDDVYVDYTDDGYYLYDVTRGGPGIAITIAD